MNDTSASNSSLENATDSSMTVLSKAEGIAMCSGFLLIATLSAVANLLTIVLFAVNKTLRKKSLFLVINMAFADLMLGTVTLPIYIYADVGAYYQLWTGGWTTSLGIFFTSANTAVTQASLISATFIFGERFYAIYWPFKHKEASMRAYHVVIVVVWTLALLIAAVWTALSLFISNKHAMYVWLPYILILLSIVCGCNIAIWRKFQHKSLASQHQNRASQNKRLTKTLLFVSVLALLSWLPLVIVNFLTVFYDPIPKRFYYPVVVINVSNYFVNPVVYALRIPEFKQALTLCRLKRNATANMSPATRLRTLQADPNKLQLICEQQV